MLLTCFRRSGWSFYHPIWGSNKLFGKLSRCINLAYITYFPHRTKGHEKRTLHTSLFSSIRDCSIRQRVEHYLEASIGTDYHLLNDCFGHDVIIYEKDKFVARVNSSCISLKNFEITKLYNQWNPSGEWRAIGKPLIQWKRCESNSLRLKLSNGSVATVKETYGPNILSTLLNKLLGIKIDGQEDTIRIDFVEGEFDTLLAYCLIAVEISDKLSRDSMG